MIKIEILVVTALLLLIRTCYEYRSPRNSRIRTIEAEVAVIVVAAFSRHSAYFSIIAAIGSLVIGCKPECADRVVERLVVLDTELRIASRGWAVETHSIVVQVPKIDIEAGTIPSVSMTRVMPLAWLPRIAAV